MERNRWDQLPRIATDSPRITEFSLTCIFLYNEKNFDFVLVRENKGQENSCSDIFYTADQPKAKWLSLLEKCPYSKFFWSLFLRIRTDVFSPNVGKYGPEKLRIRTLFTQYFHTSRITSQMKNSSQRFCDKISELGEPKVQYLRLLLKQLNVMVLLKQLKEPIPFHR